MKRFIRISALLLIAVITALSLCSCQSLDDKKEHRAFYTDSDHLEIEFDGDTYRFFHPGNYHFIDDSSFYYYDQYCVTDKDVPVLLSSWYGDSMYLNRYKNIISTSVSASEIASEIKNDLLSDPDTYGYYSYEDIYYVREDKYDNVKSILESGKLENYYFDYWLYGNYDYDYGDMDVFSDIGYDDGYHKAMLTDEQTEVVNKALKAKPDDKIKYTELSDTVKMLAFSRCDSDMILTDWATYYLIKDKDKYYFWNENTGDEKCIYPFSDDDAELVKELFDKYPLAAEDDSISWYFSSSQYKDY